MREILFIYVLLGVGRLRTGYAPDMSRKCDRNGAKLSPIVTVEPAGTIGYTFAAPPRRRAALYLPA
jgi:hypothetical protein